MFNPWSYLKNYFLEQRDVLRVEKFWHNYAQRKIESGEVSNTSNSKDWKQYQFSHGPFKVDYTIFSRHIVCYVTQKIDGVDQKVVEMRKYSSWLVSNQVQLAAGMTEETIVQDLLAYDGGNQ